MPGLIDTNVGLAGSVGMGLIWLPGGLGGPGETNVDGDGVDIFTRDETELLDRFDDPILARVETFAQSLTIYDRAGADVLDRTDADLQIRA